MSIHGFPLQVSVSCPSCHQPVHVQGLSESALCGACSSVVPLPAEVWLGWFGPAELAEALTLSDGDGRQISELGGMSAKYAYGHRLPRCQRCKTNVSVDDLGTFVEAGGTTCSCGETIRVRSAPDLARVLVPHARFVVNEGRLGDEPDESVAASEPVLFQCVGCGGALSVDGTSRTVKCRFCSASSYLPDGLWLRLHPPRTVRTFFVVADDTEQDAVAGSSPVGLLSQLARSIDPTVRRRVARNPELPAAVLLALAADPDSDVRDGVARHPNTPLEALELLTSDSDSDVLEGLADRMSVPESVLVRLLGHSSYSVRRRAVANPRTPVAALVGVAGAESDNDVVDALRNRADLSPAALRALAANGNHHARAAAAAHPGTADELLRQLATDHDSDVLRALARRPHLPADVVLQLASAADEAVSKLAVAHPAYRAASSARWRRRMIGAGVLAALVTCAGGGVGAVGLVAMFARKLLHLFGMFA